MNHITSNLTFGQDHASVSLPLAGDACSAQLVSFEVFLNTFKAKLQSAFHSQHDIDTMSLNRGFPPAVLNEIMSANPLAVCIPEEYGGRGGHIHESLVVLSAASYESLALSLTFGINWALFLQPVAKYAQEPLKLPIFERFLKDKTMGGLMITEPDYGSDALSMQTSYTSDEGNYHLTGTKHWGGLTGFADYWLVTARQRTSGGLKRDIDFFICDMRDPEQKIVVEEYYNNLGLYFIPYGRNRIDLKVPTEQKLEPHSTGIKMMLDLLHRSRLQFPGMGLGFLKRMLDEATEHCKTRLVGGKSLLNYDQVQQRLARLQSFFTVCSAMCLQSSNVAHPKNDLSGEGLQANAIKTVTTDMMQEASQSLLQLVGAKGYRLDHIAGRALVDSRPFQIFEGSNDMLYAQISETVLKLMRRAKQPNLKQFLATHPLTTRASAYFGDALSFEVDLQLSQRKQVALGRVLGRMISLELVLKLGDKGFREDLISNAIQMMQQEINTLLSNYNASQGVKVVDGYEENGAWFNFVT